MEEPQITVEEYLEGEDGAEIKHEYIGGAVYAMAGASDTHGIIALNFASELRRHLRGGPCRAFIADMKVRMKVFQNDVFYYPDIMVACDPSDNARYYRERPTVIIEVLSDATERIDRREKALSYLNIASLQEYVLVSQKTPEVTVHRRACDWAPTLYRTGDTVQLASLEFSLPLDVLYEGADLRNDRPA